MREKIKKKLIILFVATLFLILTLKINISNADGFFDSPFANNLARLWTRHAPEKCPRGTFGSPGNCEPCGECFDQWDLEVGKLRNATQALLDRVKHLLEVGTNGAYAKEFAEIEAKLERIKAILDGQKLSEDAIRDLAKKLDEMTKRLKALEQLLISSERDAESTVNRTIAVQEALRNLDKDLDRLNLLIDQLRENATLFVESDVDGAHKIILDSQNRSREAEKTVRNLKPQMHEQEQRRRLADSIYASTASRYNSSAMQNEALLASLSKQIAELEANVPAINQLVCASSSTVDNCDQLCGGSLCNKCGGVSCAEGATTKASNALDLAMQAMALLDSKLNASRQNLDALNEAKNMSEEALLRAKEVLAECDLQRTKFDKIGSELNSIMDGVDKFALIDGARPAEIRTLGVECFNLSISLKPEQILELARKINDTIASLTNIDKILAETANDLATAEQLKERADRAREMADNILETVEAVLEMLRLAAIEQQKAAAAIAAATADIEAAQGDLTEISADTELVARVIADLLELMQRLKKRLEELRKKYAQNELFVTQARTAANEAGKLTDEAEKVTDELADKVREAEEKLRNKLKLSGELKDRAERYRNDALQFASDVADKMNLLRELDDTFDEFAKRLSDYQALVDDLNKQMNQYVKDIDAKAQFYRECQA